MGTAGSRDSDVLLGPWRSGLDEGDIPSVRALFARVRAADRRGPDGIPGADAHVLLARSGGAVVGLAWRTGTDPAEVVVDPARRREGIGRSLAEQVWPGGIWAHGTLPAAAALACAAGAVPARTLLQLRRPLVGPFPVELPAGVRLRTFVPGQDDEAFLAVNGRAFAWHPEQGRLDAAAFRAEMAEPWFDPAGFFLAVTDHAPDGGDGPAAVVPATGEVVLGFHWTKVHPQDPTPGDGAAGPVGEVYVLAVDPASAIRRLGAPLTVTGLAHLHELGLSTVMLYVESDNEAALRLYRRLGFVDHAVDTVFVRP